MVYRPFMVVCLREIKDMLFVAAKTKFDNCKHCNKQENYVFIGLHAISDGFSTAVGCISWGEHGFHSGDLEI